MTRPTFTCAGDLRTLLEEAASALHTADGYPSRLALQLQEAADLVMNEDFWRREYLLDAITTDPQEAR